MKIKSALIAVLFTALVCASSSNAQAAIYVQEAPPPPIKETFQGKPGHIWTPGYYTWDSGKKSYIWHGGKLVKARKGQVWTANRWVESPKGWHFVKGKWMSRKNFNRARQQVGKTMAANGVKTCGVKKGYKIGYWKSQYDDYDFIKKHGRGKRVKDR
jgi:hypothetical protein